MRRAADRGFTLLEMLVALAIFSLAVIALLNLSAQSLRTAALVEDRALAGVVAENRLVEFTTARAVGPGRSSGLERAGDRDWRWTVVVTPTADPRLLRAEVAVRRADDPSVAASLVGFREAS